MKKGGFLLSEKGKTITRLIEDWNRGDQSALEELTPFVYDELRRLAAHYLQNERSDHTLQATALVHEAYLRLVELNDIEWQNRAHFIGVTAKLMRKIQVDHARKRNAEERGAAKSFYRESLQIWQDLQSAGSLSYADANQPEEMRQTLSRIETAEAK